MYPYLPREEFKANMLIEPWEGWESPEMPNIVKKTDTME
jgi:acetolactate synthase-1/2/3 large subunit